MTDHFFNPGMPMDKEFMNTKEVAGYLGIHEKQVYALVKENKIPCTRLTGKWIFPKNLIDRWIEEDASVNLDRHPGHRERQGEYDGSILLAAGSNDPILDILLDGIQKQSHGMNIFSSSTGSTRGLDLLAEGLTDMSFCHLFDPESGNYNIPFIKKHMRDSKIAVVHLFYREIGFISGRGESVVKSFRDVRDRKLRFINRQDGAGTRVLVDFHLHDAGISPEEIAGYDREAATHLEVCLAVLTGKADTGVATRSAAMLSGLPFSPITKESFDMIVPHSTFFKKSVQTFIETLNSEGFKSEIGSLGEYDFSGSGRILYSTT